ncbi:OmpW family outer membrane protein [Brevundimonas sp.]|uniref:OmpW family outer membrane protein n=1 Tax=Brevundimonas sp. TaxID=1871086 RepID=UPI00391CB723
MGAKRYFLDTTATSRANAAIALLSEHALDPWVVSAGVSWRFQAHGPEIGPPLRTT